MAMATLSILSLLFVFLIWFPDATRSTDICQTESCQWAGPRVHFPFRLRESNQSNRCGYDQGFELLCNDKRQTLLSISNAGDFLVKGISLEDQKVWINDPELCLPRRFLNNLDLTATHFRFSDEYSLVNMSFFNCPSNLTDSYPVEPINCVSTSNVNDNYSVIAVLPDSSCPTLWISSCQFISSALFSTIDTPRWIFWNRIHADVEFTTIVNIVKVDSLHATGVQRLLVTEIEGKVFQGRKAKYVLGLCLGIPGLIVLIVLAYIFRRKVNWWDGRQLPQQPRTELYQPVPVAVVLDVSTIEKYPTTRLDESGSSGIQLPNPTDNVCSICLCEYQAQETLRTIPQCNQRGPINLPVQRILSQ